MPHMERVLGAMGFQAVFQDKTNMECYRVVTIALICSVNFCDKNVWNLFQNDSETQVGTITVKCEELRNKSLHELEVYNSEISCGHIIRYSTEVMIVNKEWTEAKIFPVYDKDAGRILLRMVFYTHAVQRHMLQLHSSLIDHHGRGLMFLGPSGIGKTTQAELWNKYRESLIINGDIVFVQETDEGFLGWGTPWHGSSPYCENASVPLKAMIVLKQAPKNSIQELTGFEKVTEVSNSVFYPQWLENGMELCLETLDHLLTRIPVYELSCRPDEDAVRLTEETVFGSHGV